MSLVHLIIGTVCLFLAGMWGETYDREKTKKALYWAIFLGATGIVNVVAMLGAALA
jgi:hypothetical protein